MFHGWWLEGEFSFPILPYSSLFDDHHDSIVALVLTPTTEEDIKYFTINVFVVQFFHIFALSINKSIKFFT